MVGKPEDFWKGDVARYLRIYLKERCRRKPQPN